MKSMNQMPFLKSFEWSEIQSVPLNYLGCEDRNHGHSELSRRYRDIRIRGVQGDVVLSASTCWMWNKEVV